MTIIEAATTICLGCIAGLVALAFIYVRGNKKS